MLSSLHLAVSMNIKSPCRVALHGRSEACRGHLQEAPAERQEPEPAGVDLLLASSLFTFP